MRLVTAFTAWKRWFNSTRPRILVWYFLLTTTSSVASILITHQILDERIRDQSKEYVFRQIQTFQQGSQQHLTTTTLSPEKRTQAIFDQFFSQYESINSDDYAIALLQRQVYRYSKAFPAQLLSQESTLIQQWGQLDHAQQGSVKTTIGELFYIAQPIVVDGQQQGVLVIVHCAANLYKIMHSAVLLIIPATLGVMGIAAAIAWATAGRVLAPLRVLTQTAHSITESDMTRRITVEGTDEIAELTTTFNQMLDRLQIAFESQQEFIKDAGHELRTPITVIRGYLETLKYRPDRQEQTVALAIDELDRMNRLVNDLLLLAKAERPDFLVLQQEELDWLTEELYLKVRSIANRQWKLESKGLSQLWIDRQRITQAMMNLVQNAIRHTRAGDTIVLGSSVRENHAHIWVTDAGEGIAPEDQTRIFERFARATSRESPGENYGLGLSIVEAIAQAHGGWVELSSQVGQGSTFTIIIPLEINPDKTVHESNSNHRRQPSHHRLSGVRTTSARLQDHRR